MIPPAEVQLGEFSLEKRPEPPRRTIDRVVTGLAIIMVAVPAALEMIDPRPPGGCGMTRDLYVFSLGLVILCARPTWLILKGFNDAGERWLARLTAARSPRKLRPPDDF